MRINSFTSPGTLEKELIALSPEESHHLARVLRVGTGQEVTLFDGRGTRASAVITDVTKKAVTVRIVSRETVPPPPVEITLIQALPKPDRFETVLQKATELGVRRIRPVISEHTVNRSRDPEKQMDRWQTIIRNAAQQCGTSWLPDFSSPEKIGSVFPSLGDFDVVFIGSLYPEAKPLRKVFQELNKPEIKTAALLVGPEGDFTEDEVRAAVTAGATPVTFGRQILRTETAAIFGLSVLAYELF